ncbi:hypothetical protein I4U23_003939 [Adineta vaga]|nr:hypothetical protein I4U23_003939 [Adineta vaga]
MIINKLLFICVFLHISIVDTSHFRGGTITWYPLNNKPSGNTVVIQIRQRWAWRLSAALCNHLIIASKHLIGDPSVLSCISGNCNYWSNTLTTQTYCTDFSTNVDVSYGEKYDTRTIPIGVQFSIAFSSCCWFVSLVIGAGSPWNVVTRINTIIRPDGYINSSPSAAIMPLIYKQVNIQHTHVIQMVDPDASDILRCRWASVAGNVNSYNECGGVCSGIPGATLITNNCTLIFTLTRPSIYAAVALQIEDYYNETSSIPMSSVPVQFLFYGYTPISTCITPPNLISNRPDPECVDTSVGSTVTERFTVHVLCANKVIVDFVTSSPLGMTKSAIRSPSLGIYEIDFNWVPATSQRGSQSLCIGAVDNTNIQSNQLCTTYLVDFEAPSFIRNSARPVEYNYDVLLNSYILGTKPISRPSSGKGGEIHFFDATLNKLVESFKSTSQSDVKYSEFEIFIKFKKAPWIIGHSYYVKLDAVVAIASGSASCLPGTTAINDSKFWRFNIWDPSVTLVTTESSHLSTKSSLENVDDTTATTDSMQSLPPSSCHKREIQFDPDGSSLSKPINFLYNEDIHINSKVILNCTSRFSITIFWTIITCSPTCSQLTQITFSFEPSKMELFIPAYSLLNGIYELKFTLTVIEISTWSLLSSVYIKIFRSTIITNLLSFTAINITHEYKQKLILNPGKYSIDFSTIEFNTSNWYYTYYCRIYSKFNHRHYESLDDSNHTSCFSTNITNLLEYNDSLKSALTIFPEFLKLKEIYHFMVRIVNRRNSSLQSIGYLIVQIEHIQSPTITINCVISTMCSPNLYFYYVNPSTQFALFSFPTDNHTAIENIQWNVYKGLMNSSNNIMEWTSIESSWFLGVHTENLTILKDFFNENVQITQWRFEVIYIFQNESCQTTFDIEINEAPKNGFCSIHPQNGTTMTVFTINCVNWFDRDEIRDMTIYSQKNDSSKLLMLAQTIELSIQLRLPIGLNQQILVHIQDTFSCITEYTLSSISVLSDMDVPMNMSNPLIQLLSNTDNQNTIIQIITSLSETLNEMNDDIIRKADLVNDVQFQASILSSLTQTTNELSRKALLVASTKCQQLAHHLRTISTQLSFENVQFTATHIAECAINVVTSINAPLQSRANVLDLDMIDIGEILDHCRIKDNCDWINPINKKLFASSVSERLNNQSNIRFPSNLINSNKSVLIRKVIQPLASADDFRSLSNTNLSRAFSLSIINQNGSDLKILTNVNDSIEFFIPRDPNMKIPSKFLQNVLINRKRKLVFNYHLIHFTQLNSNLSYSIHFEMYPLNSNLSYLLIYKFNDRPHLDAFDGLKFFCPQDLNQNEFHMHFIDNTKTSGHYSIIYGIRELTVTETNEFCFNDTFISERLSIINIPMTFSANYELLVYQSACCYLDKNHNWQSDGLIVGPLTNHYETQCLSTHLSIDSDQLGVTPKN